MRRRLIWLAIGALSCREPSPQHPRAPAAESDSRRVPERAAERVIINADATVDCLSRVEIELVWQPVLEIIDVAQQPAPASPKLLESSCRKHVYEYGEYRLIARRTENRGLKVSTISGDATPECLATTIARAQQLLPAARPIIERGKTLFGDRWAEPDVGVLKWLECDGPSFATFLHEVNHALREGACLHDPSGAQICFDGLDDLPPRKLGRIAALPVSRNEGAPAFEQVQRVYLDKTSGEQSIVLMLDELMAYGITTEAEAALVGAGHASDRVMVLPLIAYMTMTYWDRLRRDDSSAFERALGRDSANRAALARLLARSEAAFAAWCAVRGKRKHPALDRGEDALWREYLAVKKRVFGSERRSGERVRGRLSR